MQVAPGVDDLAPEKRVQQMHHASAAKEKHIFDIVFLQAADHIVGYFHDSPSILRLR